ncbi:MAG TPA: M48 family metallopeptidase [Vicinamibacterales bacterium]|nr:M48 family metallopeptidase [Vicinamibacterales bacterium]
MTYTVLTAGLLLLAAATSAEAQLDRLRRGAETAKKVADLNINDEAERAIGESVGAKLVDRFGVYQDAAVAKYVTLVGTVLAQASSRPNLDWKFVVLDTEGVNAYAAPGGLIYITKGALGLFKTEAQLAGVLGHEITHITKKHTINAIRNAKIVDAGTDAAASARGGLSGAVLNRLSDASYDMIFENKFDRGDETESDKVGVSLAHQVGYSPQGLAEFLTQLSERNKSAKEPNGLFASHPMMKDRLNTLASTIRNDKLTSTATGQTRYASIITFDAKPASAITPVEEGTRGVAGGGSSKPAEPAKEEPKKEEPPKKRGFGIGKIASSLTGGKQAESTQASASAGGRMGVPDTNAPGGSNKTPVRVTITAAEIAEFKKGIA